MKKSAKGNMYEQTLIEIEEAFAGHLSGNHSALICVISTEYLEDPARSALKNAAEALGYGQKPCVFVTIQKAHEELDAQSLFLLVEGLDPRCVIAADKKAAFTLGQAYGLEMPLEAPSRALGRTVVAFPSFSAMLADDQDKQKAWQLLKKLPKFGKR